MEITKEIIEILNRNKIKNVNLLNFIKTYSIIRMDREGNSVLIKGKSDQEWVYIYSENIEEFRKLISRTEKEEKYFVLQEEWMLPILAEKSELEWKLICRKLFFPPEKELPKIEPCIKDLSPEEAQYIYDNYEYKMFTSVDYIKDRIERGIGIGAYENGKLIAWIITQDDGAIGFLTVLPKYRRRGYGNKLTMEMIIRIRQSGTLPFVHIEEDNYKSMSLALKNGFVKEGLIRWVKLK